MEKAYYDAHNRLKRIMDDTKVEDVSTKDLMAAKVSSARWKGFAFGILVGATVFTAVIQWLMSVLG